MLFEYVKSTCLSYTDYFTEPLLDSGNKHDRTK